MKTVFTLAILVLAILGAAVGIAMNMENPKKNFGTEVANPVPQSEKPSYVYDQRMPALIPEDQPQPKCAVDNTTYEFIAQAAGTTNRHAFVFTNEGQAPLQLAKGDSSCKCTLSELAQKSIAPGESTEVVLEWTPKSEASMFRESATIYTNDREHPSVELVVTGNIFAPYRADPPELKLTNHSRNEDFYKEFRIFSTLEDKVTVTGVSLTDKSTKDFFETTLEDLPREEWPDHKVITAGWRLKLNIKSGLPSGMLKQFVRLETNNLNAPYFDLPITGEVVADVSIFSTLPEWNKYNGSLDLGTVPKEKGTKRTLAIQVRGANRDQIKASIGKVKPEFVIAKLGEPQQLGKLTTIPLEIEVPAGSPEGAYVGSEDAPVAWVQVQLENADVPELKVKVAFSILE